MYCVFVDAAAAALMQPCQCHDFSSQQQMQPHWELQTSWIVRWEDVTMYVV